MKWALVNNERIEANPHQRALCPLCHKEVTSKCGSIKVWHWSHLQDFECDSFSEPETEWHLNWKNNFEKEEQESVIGKHRADVRTKKGLVIEFQNSPISPEQIEERENFYNNMIWVFNGQTFAKGLQLRFKPQSKGIYTFRWKHPSKSLWVSKKTVYIDINNFYDRGVVLHRESLFLIKKVYHNIPCGGWGILTTKKEFLKQVKERYF